MERKVFLLLIGLAAYFGKASGCQVAGVSNWWVDLNVVDTDRGVVFQGATTDISGIQLAEQSGDGLNSGPYLVATHADSMFTLSLSENFERYEEDETTMSMSFSVTFTCSTGSTNNILFIISVIDTNNNDPIFSAGDEITFTVTPPLPPGYLVTGCVGGINVRDIDLTTQRIEFEIEENDYFEIAYDAASSSEAKNFAALLRTTTFIRSLPEPVSLRISATDVDLTGDAPRTTYATLRIEADGYFELPEEPVFSQVFYLANYSADHMLALQQPVFLAQGYDDDVSFNLTGEYASFFQLVRQSNQVNIDVTSPLPADVMALGHLLLVLTASREYTSGASATIVVQMPEVQELKFEEDYYEGTIVDDILVLSQVILTQGYENGYELTISGEYASLFVASQQSNIITLTKLPLEANIIQENTFLTLQLTATSSTSSAATVILLEIIKNDTVTPIFEERLYTGSYNADTGLDISAITLYQGYDDTVSFYMQGDYESYFTLIENMNVLTLQLVLGLPEQVLQQQQQPILLTVGASKPRTVGAHTVVSISLPEVRQLLFEEASYTGTVVENIITLEPITLSTGYASDVNFTLNGEYASFFTATNIENLVTINLTTPLATAVIQENNFITLILEATGSSTLKATATIVLEIIKQDATTPTFERRIYYGTYEETNTVTFDSIVLTQGYDNTVSFRLEGDQSQYFTVSNSENSVVLSLEEDIPEDIIFSNKVLLFSIIAEKPLTVGANAAVAVTFPQALTDAVVMKFARNHYVGYLENETLILENITLEIGYTASTVFTLSGELASYFAVSSSGNVISIQASTILPEELLETTGLIVLEIYAERVGAVAAHATIIIDILSREAISAPVFDEVYYQGVYIEESGLQFERTIYLQQGFDETVTFDLEGESSVWFTLEQNGDGVRLTVANEVPQVVLENNRQLLFTVIANKPGTLTARATISIDLPDYDTSGLVLRFAQPSYVGGIENGTLQLQPLSLLGEYAVGLNFTISGEYSSYFTVRQEGNSVTIELLGDLPTEIISNDTYLVLDLKVTRAGFADGFTTIVLEILGPDKLTPVFGNAFYTGSYSVDDGLAFEYTIQLVQGYDETVEFKIEGEDGERFAITQDGNRLTLSIMDEGLSQVTDRTHLVFAVAANKPGTLPGTTAVIISLTDTQGTATLRFSNPYYYSSIVNGTLLLENINLAEGYAPDVNFTVTGALAEFFEVTNDENEVILQLLPSFPTNISESILILTLEARSLTAVAYSVVVVELIRVDIEFIAPVFEEPYYQGSYSEIDGFSFNHPIRLTEGFDASIVFSLEGEQSTWFTIQQNGEVLTLVLATTIPQDVLESNRNLVFSVLARRGNLEGRSAIVISLIEDSSPTLIGFAQNYIVGQLQSDYVNMSTIVVSEGYSEEITFTLQGDLAEYFNVTDVAGTITLELSALIPEDILGINRIILLELRASAPQAIPAYAVIVLDNSANDILTPLVFTEPYYTGAYTQLGLDFNGSIALSNGNNGAVTYALEGDNIEWFTLEQTGNVASVGLASALPEELLNNHNLIFTITASLPGHASSRAAIVISLMDAEVRSILRFEEIHYLGCIENNELILGNITLSEGYTEDVAFALYGELSSLFNIIADGPSIIIVLVTELPESSIPPNRLIILELEAISPQAVSAYATILFEVATDSEEVVSLLEFAEPYYTGLYTEEDGLIFESVISLSDGHDENATFGLSGDYVEYFALAQANNSITISLVRPLPVEVLANNERLIFVITAQKPGSNVARSAIIISLTDVVDPTAITVLRFERNIYQGIIQNYTTSSLDIIELTEGFSDNVDFALQGELADFFTLTSVGSTVTISLEESLSEESIPDNRIIILQLQASGPQAISTYTTIIFEVTADVHDDNSTTVLQFTEIYYTGSYNEANGSLVFENNVSLVQGYSDNVTFALEGDSSQWFTLEQSGNSLSLILLSALPPQVLESNQMLVFSMRAQTTDSNIARTVIVISLITIEDSSPVTVLRFNSVNYQGRLETETVSVDEINLAEGYSDNVQFTVQGELSEYFRADNDGANVSLALTSSIPEDILQSVPVTVLDITASADQAISAFASVILRHASVNETITIPVFSEIYYVGSYNIEYGLSLESDIVLSQGFDNTVEFELEGDNSQWFTIEQIGNSVILRPSDELPVSTLPYGHFLFAIVARKTGTITATAGIFILIEAGTASNSDASFGSALYTGIVQSGEVSHETITVSGYNGTGIQILGANADSFEATLNEEEEDSVTVRAVGALILPEDITYIALELRAGAARTALILDIYPTDAPAVPTVTFSSASYEIHTDVTRTGLVGTVLATADNGERIVYTLQTDNAHLLERLAVNEAGELVLFAPASSGVYAFTVEASTVATRVSASAPILLIVDAITTCGENEDLVVPPLIVLDRDEEEEHTDLILSNSTGCRFALTNRWPVDQDWLYVDDSGLHSRAIDREDPSIAFMALSQVQVELILECDSDVAASSRSKRSGQTRLSSLGPYDYGNNKWLIADTILYNSRRSFVNLIVNDINDNPPVFTGTDIAPMPVGYPVPDLLDVVPPRALVELKATDADVGENAALLYWSSEPELAVSPYSGSVHVRDNERELQEGRLLTVHATDRNGEGLTGDITLVVRLLDVEHICVVTVRDAFLEDEQDILNNLTQAVGYDVKALMSTVVSDEYEDFRARTIRQAEQSRGASLRIYVYGLRNTVPVDVYELTSDINSNVIASVVIAESVSLQDYLESHEICAIPGRDTGLLAATIVLSVLLFILIVLIALWYFLKWRQDRSYEEFSDQSSMASRNDLNVIPKPDTLTRPRLNIDELKRSERRLQQMLDAPVSEMVSEPSSSRTGEADTTILDVPLPNINVPIVIQSIDKLKAAADVDDDEDEFGERKNNARRKSVVTFNENVEKIIHVEDRMDSDSEPEYEVERL